MEVAVDNELTFESLRSQFNVQVFSLKVAKSHNSNFTHRRESNSLESSFIAQSVHNQLVSLDELDGCLQALQLLPFWRLPKNIIPTNLDRCPRVINIQGFFELLRAETNVIEAILLGRGNRNVHGWHTKANIVHDPVVCRECAARTRTTDGTRGYYGETIREFPPPSRVFLRWVTDSGRGYKLTAIWTFLVAHQKDIFKDERNRIQEWNTWYIVLFL